MPKYCKSCGREYKEKYCEHCGYKNPDIKIKASKKYQTKTPKRFLSEEEREKLEKERRADKNKKSKLQTVILIVIASAVLGLVVFVLYQNGLFTGSRSCEEVINQYFTAVADMDYEKYNDCMLPEEAKANDSAVKESGLDKENAMETLYSDYAEVFGSDIKAQVSVVEEKELDDLYLDKYINSYEKSYEKEPGVSEVRCTRVDTVFSGSKSESKMTFDVYTGLKNRTWYVINIKDIENSSTITE